jgi:hypothetical protein
MSSHPYDPSHPGVELLLGHWSGEGVYFWLEDDEHIKLVQSIGRPRIIEIAIPLGLTTSAYSAAKAVIAAFVKAHGHEPDEGAFDLYATSALGADAVLTEGDPDFGSSRAAIQRNLLTNTYRRSGKIGGIFDGQGGKIRARG